MDTSNDNQLNILDLPNEILLNIFNKLNTVDVLYSLVDVNKRFDQLVLDLLRHLDMTIISCFDRIFSIENRILNRICEKILPRIHQQIHKLTLEPHSMEHVLLAVNYPELYSLSLINFQGEIFFQYLTGILFDFLHFN